MLLVGKLLGSHYHTLINCNPCFRFLKQRTRILISPFIQLRLNLSIKNHSDLLSNLIFDFWFYTFFSHIRVDLTIHFEWDNWFFTIEISLRRLTYFLIIELILYSRVSIYYLRRINIKQFAILYILKRISQSHLTLIIFYNK